jgi:rfaE bifunctional protein kinase chain/domain
LIEQLAPDRGFEFDRFCAICRRHDIAAHTIDQLLTAFSEKRVLVIGDLIIDKYVLCDATDLASEAAMMSLTRLEEQVYVGGAGIVARHLAGLGATPYLLSTAGHDEYSAMAQGVLENESITTKLIPCRDKLPEKTRFLVETSKLLRVEEGQSHPLDSVAEQKAFDWITSISGGFDAVVFCDFGYGTITGGLWERMQRWLRRKVGVVVADISGQRGQLTRFKNVNLLCPTERELRTALNDFESGLSSVAWKALEQTQARQLMVTLGKKGLVVFDRQSQDANCPEWRGRLRSEYLPTLADRVVDPLGCGDSLLAVTTMALAGGGNLMQAAYLGSAAAAWQIAHLGNLPLDSAGLRRFLDTRPEMVPASPSAYSGSEAATDPRPCGVEDEVDLLTQAQKWRDQYASISRHRFKPSIS